MKTATSLTLILCAALNLGPVLRADPPSPYGTDINAPSPDDPTLFNSSSDSAADKSDDAQKEEKPSQDQDWLMRNYQQAAAAHPQFFDKNTNLYYRISSDKNLAKLAGLTPTDDDSSDPTATPRTGVTGSGAGAPTLRSDSDSSIPGVPGVPQHSSAPRPFLADFKPLITPIGEADVAGLHNFYTPLTVTGNTQNAPAAAPSQSDQPSEATDLDTPGMTAVESDPEIDKVSTDLTLNSPADDALPQNPSQGEGKDSLPLATNMERVQQQEAAELQSPVAEAKVVPPVSINPAQIKLPPDLEPMKMLPLNPVHPGIADPRDFFDH
jgi:hypothetical protein